MKSDREAASRSRAIPIAIAIVVGLLGLVMAGGGIWLIMLGGSWYYLLAGAGLLIASVQLVRGQRSGAWWFLAVLAVTIVWTLWESGLNYWGWIPRTGLLAVLGIAVALSMARLYPRSSLALRGGIAGGLAVCCLVAFGLMFAPHGFTGGDQPLPNVNRVAEESNRSDQPASSPANTDWVAYGRNNAATRYSPLDSITPDNVSQLEQVWTYHTGDLPEKRYGAETTPLKVDDRIYLCSARNVMIGLDARNGNELWRYDPKVEDKSIPYTAACRGVAYYEVPEAKARQQQAATSANTAATGTTTDNTSAPDPIDSHIAADAGKSGACKKRIIEGTLDGRLVAVSADTGKPCADFGDNGEVDITKGMGETPAGYVAINSAPTIVNGVIVTGHQVLDGQRRWAPSGVILGYDAVTGELRWAWDMVHPDRKGLPPEGETYARGTPNMWTTATGDDDLGLVYLPLGAPTGQYLSSSRRPAENKYSDALVALDVETGRPAWHFQTHHRGVWDYDLGSQGTLVDFPTDNGPVPALVLPTKQGDMYVLNRKTGEPLTGIEERPVPGGGVEPDQRSKTQPFSQYHTLRKPKLTPQDMWGITPIDQLACRIRFQRANYDGIYTPPSADKPWIQYPGYNGGSDWGGIAIDPNRDVIVANYNDIPNYNQMVPREEAQRQGWKPRDEGNGANKAGGMATGFAQLDTPFGYTINAGWRLPITQMPCKQPPYGGIRAINLATGETLWDRPLGTAVRNGPFGLKSHLPFTIGTPNNGGSVITAGGLIFVAATTDDMLRAIDLRTGETVWRTSLPAGGQATPIVYSIDGREYVMIMAAGHHFMGTPGGDSLLAFALPK